MNGEKQVLSISRAVSCVRPSAAALIGLAATLGLGGCVEVARVDPFAAGGVDPHSAVAAQVRAASDLAGAYPRFSALPPAPTDVRAPAAWRAAVADAWTLKLQTETDAARIPFTLNDSQAWADAELATIPADQAAPPAPDSEAQTEAFATAMRARATPPPPPN